MVDLYEIGPYEGPQRGGSGSALPFVEQDVREAARSEYAATLARAGANSMPLVIAAYPNEDGSTKRVVDNPGAGTKVTTYPAEQIPAVLPGSDLLVALRARMSWVLPVAASTVTSASSSIASSASGTAHTHTVTTVTSAGGSSHSHTVSSHTSDAGGGTVASAAMYGISTGVAQQYHSHLMFTDKGVAGYGLGTPHYYDTPYEAGEKRFAAGYVSTGDFRAGYPDTPVYYASPHNHTHNVTIPDHTHDIGAKTSTSEASHTHSVSGQTANTEAAHTHNIDHVHAVGPTTARVSCIMSLVIDGVVITSGAVSGAQFHVEGFAGRVGTINMENIFILRKTSTTDKLLSGGQHDIGLYFSITTTDFGTGTVDIQNASFIVQDAGFDERLRIYNP